MAYALMESGPEGEAEALALAVAFGEAEGGTFDWDAMNWVRQDG